MAPSCVKISTCGQLRCWEHSLGPGPYGRCRLAMAAALAKNLERGRDLEAASLGGKIDPSDYLQNF